jgi:hypothetical protein
MTHIRRAAEEGIIDPRKTVQIDQAFVERYTKMQRIAGAAIMIIEYVRVI